MGGDIDSSGVAPRSPTEEEEEEMEAEEEEEESAGKDE